MALLGLAVLETAVDLSGLDKGLSDAEGQANKGASGISGIFSGALGVIGTTVIAGAAAAAVAVGAIGVAAFGVASDVKSAANDMQAELGLTAGEAERLADIAGGVWANNFGDNMAQVADVVSEARQQLGAMADDELTRVATNALRLSDTFGVDYAQSLNGVKALTESLGLSSDQAFDLITTGMQNGLNTSGDFIESITEYSGVFAGAGFSADQMFGIMETGLATGVLGTDKIADAVKEMGVKLNEAGDDTRAAFDTIGLSFDDIQTSVKDGSATWGDYFNDIVGGINGIEDPILRQQAQVAIFGTMAEDLGVSFTEGLSTATTALDDMAGATDGLDVKYQNLGDMFEGFKRQALLALEPIGAILLDIGARVMPIVEQGFAWFGAVLVPMIAAAADAVMGFFGEFSAGVSAGLAPLDAFKLALSSIVPPEAMIVIGYLIDSIGGSLLWAFESIIDIVQAVNALFRGDFASAGELLAGVIQGAIDTITETFGNLAESAGPALADFWANLTAWFQDTDFAALGVEVATKISEGIGQLVEQIGPVLANAATAFWDWVQSVDWYGLAVTILTGIVAGLEAFDTFAQSVLTTWAMSFWIWVQSVDWRALAIEILTAIAEGLETFDQYAQATLAGWYETFINWAQSVDWKQLAIDIILKIAGALETFNEYASGVLAGWYEAFLTWAAGVDWAGIGQSIIDGITAGLSAAGQALYNLLADIARGALNAVKEALGIGSPSKAFAELGGWIMMGLAEGIASAAGLPVAAVVDAAAGVELAAVGELVGILTAMVAAVAPAIAALRLLESFDIPHMVIANIQEFGFQIHWLTRVFAVMAYQLEGGVKKAKSMSDAVIKIADMVIVGLDALKRIETANIPAGLTSKYQALATEIGGLTAAIAAVAEELDQELLKHTSLFVKAAKDVLGLVEDGLAAAAALSAADFGAIVQGWHLAEQITIFRNIIRHTVREFIEASVILSADMATAVNNFTEAAAGVLGLVEDGLAAAVALSAADFAAIVQGWHLADQITIMRNIIRALVRSFSEAAAEFDPDLAGSVANFTEAAGAVLGLIVDAIAGAAALSAVDFGAIVQGWHLADQIEIFRNIIRALVRAFSEAAAEFTSDVLSAAKDFADAAGRILGVIQPGIDAIAALGAYVAAENLMGQAERFAADILAVTRILIVGLTLAAAAIGGEAIAAAAAVAGDLQKILAIIKPGGEALAALAEYVRAADLAQKAAAFVTDLVSVAMTLVQGLTVSAADIGGDALASALAIARDLADLADTLAKALKSLQEIGNADRPDLGPAMAYIMQVAALIANTLTASHATINGTVLAAARAFRENVGIIVSEILMTLDYLRKLMLADTPGGLQKILDAMIASLRSTAPPAGQAADQIARAIAAAFTGPPWESIGEGIGAGIARGIARSANRIAAAATDAANNAYRAAQRALGIASPSRLFAELGEQISAGLAGGIVSGAPMPLAAVSGVVADLAAVTAGRGAASPVANYFSFELAGGQGDPIELQIRSMIDAALRERGIRADYWKRNG